MPQAPESDARRRLLGSIALLLACATWWPLAHLAFSGIPGGMLGPGPSGPEARALARRLEAAALGPPGPGNPVSAVDRVNPEWGLMTRSFLEWSLAEMALRDPGDRARRLAAMDALRETTLRIEREEGFRRFLLPYGRTGEWESRPARSLFVDAEIALSLGLRCLVEERPDLLRDLRERTAGIARRLAAAPALLLESYPGECWLFDHATALAALRVADAVAGTDHADLRARWVAGAKARFLDPATGLLCSTFDTSGRVVEGPEGSSLLWSLHCLRLVDAEFARSQYAAARRELHRALLGFGFAREWPEGAGARGDVDSGAVVPVLGASPSASGFALVAASSFGDADAAASLARSLGLAAFPVEEGDGLRFAAGNALGDAVLLYAFVQGPAWDEVLRRRAR